MISNNELSPVVTVLLIRKRKLNIHTVFITQSYSQVPQDFSLNSTRFYNDNFKQTRTSTNRV